MIVPLPRDEVAWLCISLYVCMLSTDDDDVRVYAELMRNRRMK